MIKGVFVDIDDVTSVDATDPAVKGITYRLLNANNQEYEFYLSDGAVMRKIVLQNDTPDFRNEFMLMQ